ncbi:RraA family protein [Pseudonocardia asaccharolytica]|uniref:Putative 4-hydroxy-4-methyl-2-oxoglutarate aldolase n=1 Tax=Pseudonocardia asaccharolytica DSM 44247 = NBRC 16224 TaxID=1123024 RepID=A0A511D122_9PSEU|nr:hypothetical protein [Pseudonocardia asaccharolytica]GEL17234.1 diguanylate cyclase [Pseudonocardia asaccharolytica DSM 44247 = NBRC 16224]
MTIDEIMQRLATLDTPTVSDALDRLDCPGAVLGVHGLSGGSRISGRVVTVELGPPDAGPPAPSGQPPSTPARHLGTAAVEASGPGDVIVVANGGRTEVAGWGGVLSLAAHLRGVEGVLVDGAVRDVDDAVRLSFPVYARRAVPRTARGRVVEHSWNEPIRFADIAVSPGDLVIADRSGVVFVQRVAAVDVLRVAGEIAAHESAMVRRLYAGEPVSQVMGAHYEELLEDR